MHKHGAIYFAFQCLREMFKLELKKKPVYIYFKKGGGAFLRLILVKIINGLHFQSPDICHETPHRKS